MSIPEASRANVETLGVFVLGDVSYGACCVDDLKAQALGTDFLIHFGHSCLVPTQHTQGDVGAGANRGSSSSGSGLKVQYVFVDILVDPNEVSVQLQELLLPTEKVALQGTIQYTKTLHAVKRLLDASGYFLQPPLLPQVLPLTAGEVLGSTAFAQQPLSHRHSPPVGPPGGEMPEISTVVFLADGRFHLEASMIQNPGIRFLRFDPFTKFSSEILAPCILCVPRISQCLYRESYDHQRLHKLRTSAIQKARTAKTVGLLFSTLGRQGSVGLAEDLLALLEKRGIAATPILMAEFAIHKLQALFPFIDAFIQASPCLCELLPVGRRHQRAQTSPSDAMPQIGCPRLSIDWGASFPVPLLSPYEAHVAFGEQPYLEVYPMDFYARDGGPWTNYNASGGDRRGSLAVRAPLESRKAELRARLLEKQQQKKLQGASAAVAKKA
ncbi:diphthamide synthase subunit dph2 [Cyclospora cayetanensis]|uniref:2-(3-amino-3-carboxypropyl)histidine synthase subunit 1 n=1 Tax=Cyclospora cayetanensis TaxID=88456 RepID=A0A1D3D019_9EIME|nr:diphthamide synthase subunit dph2 [Cyclospora cayetanensis]